MAEEGPSSEPRAEPRAVPRPAPRDIPFAIKALISRAFSPCVSVIASSDAEELAESLGFRSLLDLFEPFAGQIPGRVTVRDSQGSSVSFDDFCIRFGPSIEETPDESTTAEDSPARSSVSLTAPNPQLSQLFTSELLGSYIVKKLNELNASQEPITPDMVEAVYLDYITRILSASPVVPFETFAHPVTGILAVSSRNPDPIDTLSTLLKRSYEAQIPDYVNRDYLRYFLLVHDEQGDNLNESIALFEKMKRHFGLHCYMLRINRPAGDSTVAPPASHWKTLEELAQEPIQLPQIHAEDLDALQRFVRELVVQVIVPFMERCIASWNDQVASSRRGITGRFFSASKKYFASSTRATSSILSSASALGQSSAFPFSLPGSSASTTPTTSRSPTPPIGQANRGNYHSSRSSYGYLTPEAQIRKLADFAFMLRDYKFANTTYELLKRDFHNDKAWSYLASSQEMAAISQLMASETLSTKTRLEVIDPLLDSAAYSYISRCSLQSYALRCLLLSSELLCTQKTLSAASDGATKWILKALNERLVGRYEYAMLMERIAGAYAICEEAEAAPGQAAPSHVSKLSQPIPRANNRRRKAAFWMLLAAREWHDASMTHRSAYCVDQADGAVYNSLDWAHRATGLLGRLQATSTPVVPS